MNTYPMKLVTVVAESLARAPIETLLAEAGAQGFTVFPVEGKGAGGARLGDIGEYGNVQFEVVVQPAIAQHLLERLHAELLPRYALIVFESDVRVLRPQKF